MTQDTQGKYAEVNGLKMYYEIHGAGKPLVLLHGAFGLAEGWTVALPTLTKTHQVIAVELQGHGHTADADRPLSFEQMADDVAALLRTLDINATEVFGYSMGGSVALALAIRHPELVQKMAILGATAGATKDTYDPETYRQFENLTPENFNYPQVKDPYLRIAPDPSKWPVLISKIYNLAANFKGFDGEDLKGIKAPALIMLGDHDAVRPEHAVEMFRLLPNAQLAIIPGDHFLLFTHLDTVLATLTAFLDAPTQEP